ncbi:MAG: potassium/proton antiporter [Synechocystis sp.]|nr:potassium/proton antiporter [Synechocystis sp.]
MLSTEQIFVVVGILLIVSVLASKAANRFGIPSLLLFLVIGMLAGTDGIGQIDFDYPKLAMFVGNTALTIILFSGGLDTEWQKIRPVLKPGLSLATLGVLLSVGLVGTFAWWMLGSFSDFKIGTDGISWGQGLLLGAIISSTDAAAVFSVFKASPVPLPVRIQGLLELESGTNDPMAVLLTMSILKILTVGDFVPFIFLGQLVLQIGVAIALGYGAGRLMCWSLNHLSLPSSGLYPVFLLALVFLTSGLTTLLGGSAVLAVYIAGVVLGNRPFTESSMILSFQEGITWLAQILMFLTFGLLIVPDQLPEIAGVGTAIALFMMLIARPISVFISLSLSQWQLREKIFIAWVGLRGSVPMILAVLPLTENLDQADELFNVVFFVVLLSIGFQGLTLLPAGRWLGVLNAK